jgi:hypothetical protein
MAESTVNTTASSVPLAGAVSPQKIFWATWFGWMLVGSVRAGTVGEGSYRKARLPIIPGRNDPALRRPRYLHAAVIGRIGFAFIR